jgi:hypothetical protein
MIKLSLFFFLFIFLNLNSGIAQHTMESDIWLADIRIKEGNVYFGAAKNIINHKGYDNQPYFLNDSTILYTHIGDDLQADIYSYAILSKKHSQFTSTKESEYSAKLTPSRNAVSVVEVEQDSAQRIWQFNLQGNNGKVMIAHIDSVGYYNWLTDTTLAAFILTNPPSLQICSTTNAQTKTIAVNIGRCMQLSAANYFYFTMLETDSVRWLCRTNFNGTITKLIEFYKGVEDFVVSKQNLIFCAKGGLIYYTDENFAAGWRLCGNFEGSGLHHINRIALSDDQKKMALVEIKQ